MTLLAASTAVEAGVGAVMLLAGLLVLRYNRAVGGELAELARYSNDPRHSLLNKERAELVQDAESDPGDHRFYALCFGAFLLLGGGFVFVSRLLA